MTKAGYYYAEGDPGGTVRYWDGSTWVGGPVTPQAKPAPPPQYSPPHPPAPQSAQLAPEQHRAPQPTEGGSPQASSRHRKWLVIGGGLAAFLLLGVIVDGLSSDQTETSTAPVTTAVAAPTVAEFQGMSLRELIVPPDEAAFLTGVNMRTEVGALFSNAELLGWAVRGCELGDRYIHGSRPSLVEVLTEVIASETTLSVDDADDLASAITNSSIGTVCTVEVVDANTGD